MAAEIRNLWANPRAVVQVGRRRLTVEASTVAPAEGGDVMARRSGPPRRCSHSSLFAVRGSWPDSASGTASCSALAATRRSAGNGGTRVVLRNPTAEVARSLRMPGLTDALGMT